MGWRKVNGRAYFYECFRDGDEVKVVYWGRGPAAEKEALKLAKRKEARELRRQVITDVIHQMELADQAFCRVELLLHGVLVAAGFYRSSWGEWRPRRSIMSQEYTPARPLAEDLQSLVKEANRGGPKAIGALREFLRAYPEVWRQAGDLSALAMEALLKRISGGDSLVAESIRLQVEEYRKCMTSAAPCVAERLATDALVLAWVEFHSWEFVSPAERILPPQLVSRLEKAASRRFSTAGQLCVLVRQKLGNIERVSQDLQLDCNSPQRESAVAFGNPTQTANPLPSGGDCELAP